MYIFGKIILEVMVCFLFFTIWLDLRQFLAKSRPIEKELTTISFITIICIVGIVIGSVINWCM